jgi:hypothetical protein
MLHHISRISTLSVLPRTCSEESFAKLCVCGLPRLIFLSRPILKSGDIKVNIMIAKLYCMHDVMSHGHLNIMFRKLPILVVIIYVFISLLSVHAYYHHCRYQTGPESLC